MPEPTDAELVGRAARGDRDAFGELVRRHHARVAGLCASLLDDPAEADDAAQEVFVKAYRKLSAFRADAQLSTWLYRVATNHCLDARRKTARRRQVSLDALIEQEGDAVSRLFEEGGPRPGAEEDADLARRLLASLPEGYREVLVLRETEGLSYDEMARVLDCSLDAVKARLKRARAALHDGLRHFSAPGDVQSP
jgi:RNA polymerase sigma-70 factor, ECF subfamily